LAIFVLPGLLFNLLLLSLLLFNLHWLATARERAIAALGDDHLGAALAALIPLAYLVCHAVAPGDNFGMR
jgi:hypothetical protein